MKLKILTVMVLTMALVGPAAAEVPTGLGLGYQGMFVDNIINGASARYWMSDNMGIEGDLFHLYVDNDGPIIGTSTYANVIALMGKCLYAPVVKENSRFYIGGQLGYAIAFLGGAKNDTHDLNLGGLMGAEYSFSDLPELGFNFEVGYLWNYTFGPEAPNIDVHLFGINVSLGVHYYF